MNGLHSCKPGNEPVVGQVKTFVVQQMVGKSGKPYTKIKSANAENGGTPYKITAAKPTGHTDSYGNVSFNLDIEPANGSPQTTAPGRGNGSAGNGDDRSNRIERQHSQEMALRYFTLRKMDAIDTDALRKMIDWFQRDIGHVPSPKKRVVDVEPDQIDIGGEISPPDEMEPF